jgi:hypothetical protein
MASLGHGPKPVGPRHDAAPEPTHPAPVATPQAALLPVPKRVADGMPLAPTTDYLADVASPKSGITSLSTPKLVVFDLDGTVCFFFVPLLASLRDSQKLILYAPTAVLSSASASRAHPRGRAGWPTLLALDAHMAAPALFAVE